MASELTKQQRAQVKSLMQDQRWSAVERFIALKLEQWRSERASGSTAFEELRAIHTKEGKIDGVIELFNQMEQGALDD